MSAPSPQELRVLRILSRSQVPPSVREIAAELGISAWSWPQALLVQLEAKGLVGRRPGIARGIWLTPEGKAYLGSALCSQSLSRRGDA